MELTHKRLLEVLMYDAETGVFTWRCGRGRVKVGSVAGRIWRRGIASYVEIFIDRRVYKAHRLAWFYTTGKWPQHQIDHIDGNPINNRIANLRDVPHVINSRNMRRQSRNKSGVTGVYWVSRISKWRASIEVNGNQMHLGYFATLDDAILSRRNAESANMFHENHGRR